jgi:hypothetical protein
MNAERRWTCEGCQCLLGIERGGRLHVKIGALHYIVEGPSYRVTAVCRRCAAVGEITRGSINPEQFSPFSPETQDVQRPSEALGRPARKAERSDRQLEP